jgi:hypothetical protein
MRPRQTAVWRGEGLRESVRPADGEPDLEEMFAVLEPAALAATAQALSDAEWSHAATLRAFELSVERARYESSGPGANTTRSSQRTGWSPAPWNDPRCELPRPF